MARLQLSKSALHREEQRLSTFSRVLPSLDLKRRQLMAERGKARRRLAETREAIEALLREVGAAVPMLANRNVDLDGLARVTDVSLASENVVGTRLPKLEAVAIETHRYANLGTPHWVDRVLEALRRMIELRIRAQVEERRLALLEQAVKKVTQRVNLFEKVLIPRARANIKKIHIVLGDAERAAVVTSKLAKAKQLARAAS